MTYAERGNADKHDNIKNKTNGKTFFIIFDISFSDPYPCRGPVTVRPRGNDLSFNYKYNTFRNGKSKKKEPENRK